MHPCMRHARKAKQRRCALSYQLEPKVDLQIYCCGWSPLYAACHNGHTEAVHALLSAGAKANLQTKDGGSPLHVACFEGHMEMVRALLSRGAKVDLLTEDGVSPLYMASQGGYSKVDRALLSSGAKIDMQSNDLSPLHTAILAA